MTDSAHRLERTFETTEPLTVRVKNRLGDVSATAVPNLNRARVVLACDADIDLALVAISFNDGRLQIEVPERLGADGADPAVSFAIGTHSWNFGNQPPSISIRVEVPQSSSITASTGSGDVTLAGEFAAVDLSTGQGDVTAEHTGPATCSTGSGDISIRTVDGDLSAKTGSGDISVEHNTAAVRASTGSGDITVAKVFGEGTLSSGSGDLLIGELDGSVKLSSGSGDLTINEIAGGRVGGQTASGDITFGVRRAIPVWTDCTTMTGEVSSNLLGGGQPGEGQPYIEIRATTVSGDITLTEV